MSAALRVLMVMLMAAGAVTPVPAGAARSVFHSPVQSAASRAEAIERERGQVPDAASPDAASAPASAPPPQPDAASAAEPPPQPTPEPEAPQAPATPPAPPITAPASRVPESAVSVGPRTFGLALGDLLTQGLALPEGNPALAAPDQDLALGRVGPWFERRGLRREVDAQGRHRLLIDYQIVNAPTVQQALMLPPLTVSLAGGQRLAVPPLPVTVAPLTTQPEAAALRPDRWPTPPDERPARQRALAAGAAVLGVALAWAVWAAWRARRDTQVLPFTRAWPRVRAADPSADAPWLEVHHAFNAAAGRTVQASNLAALFARWPAAEARRDDIEGFFRASSSRFFQADSTAPSFDVRAFAQRMRELEQRTL